MVIKINSVVTTLTTDDPCNVLGGWGLSLVSLRSIKIEL